MRLSSKLIEARLSGKKSLLEQLEQGISEKLSAKDKRLRYFIISKGKRTAKVEVSYLTE